MTHQAPKVEFLQLGSSDGVIWQCIAFTPKTEHWRRLDGKVERKFDVGKEHVLTLTNETPYSYGKKHGDELEYSDGTLIRQTTWLYGVINRCVHYADGKKHGVETMYRNGKLFTTTDYVRGERHGFERMYDNGDLISELPVVHDVPHGTETFWRKDGTIDVRRPFVDGMVHGYEEWYDRSGCISHVVEYTHGYVRE